MLATEIYKLPEKGQLLWIVEPTSSLSQNWESRKLAYEKHGVQLFMDFVERNGECYVSVFTATKQLTDSDTRYLSCRCVVKYQNQLWKAKYSVPLSKDWCTRGKRDLLTFKPDDLQ